MAAGLRTRIEWSLGVARSALIFSGLWLCFALVFAVFWLAPDAAGLVQVIG